MTAWYEEHSFTHLACCPKDNHSHQLVKSPEGLRYEEEAVITCVTHMSSHDGQHWKRLTLEWRLLLARLHLKSTFSHKIH